MREDVKIKILQNLLREITKKYDYFISMQENVLKATFEKAIKDSLTGLYNRNYLIERLKQFEAKIKRNKSNIILVFLDLNNFKQINDAYGHKKGDEVLKGIANLMKETFREYDLIVRYGGDEFIIIIEKEDEKDLNIENIIKKLNNNINKKYKKYNISLAYGIAISNEVSDKNFDLNKLIELADEKMYENKNKIKKLKKIC